MQSSKAVQSDIFRQAWKSDTIVEAFVQVDELFAFMHSDVHEALVRPNVAAASPRHEISFSQVWLQMLTLSLELPHPTFVPAARPTTKRLPAINEMVLVEMRIAGSCFWS
jgi:hypothetical protein